MRSTGEHEVVMGREVRSAGFNMRKNGTRVRGQRGSEWVRTFAFGGFSLRFMYIIDRRGKGSNGFVNAVPSNFFVRIFLGDCIGRIVRGDA